MNEAPLTVSDARQLITLLRRISDQSATIHQTADWLGVDVATVYRWVRRGEHLEKLPGARPIRITVRSIVTYLQNSYYACGSFNIFDET